MPSFRYTQYVPSQYYLSTGQNVFIVLVAFGHLLSLSSLSLIVTKASFDVINKQPAIYEIIISLVISLNFTPFGFFFFFFFKRISQSDLVYDTRLAEVVFSLGSIN